jgi:hypothetical protein
MFTILLKGLFLFALITLVGLLLALGVVYVAWALSRQDNGW